MLFEAGHRPTVLTARRWWGKDIETHSDTRAIDFYKNYGFDAQAIDAEIAKPQGARDEYVRAANDRLFGTINQEPGLCRSRGPVLR